MKSFYFAACLLVLAAGCAFAAPQPTMAKVPNIWTLDVTFEHPQQIMIKVPGDQKPTRFWYMILTLTNSTGRDVDFYPHIELATDTLKTVQASQGLRQAVFDKIKLRHQAKYPFLESLEYVDNKILQGQDNTRDIAVVFPDFDPNAKKVSIFVSGLSNETKTIDHPTAKTPESQPEKVILKKTLQLEYASPGDKALRATNQLIFVDKRWVMR